MGKGTKDSVRLTEEEREILEPLVDSPPAARLVAIACSQAPEGRAASTLQLLAAQLVALEIVDARAQETVRKTLQQTTSSPG